MAWALSPFLPEGRSGLGVAAWDGLLYAACGAVAGGVTAALSRYSPYGGGWAEMAVAPTERFFVGAAALDGRLYVCGGNLADGTVLATVEAYNPHLDSWYACADLPVAKECVGTVACLDGLLYSAGGYEGDHSTGNPVDYLHIYTPVTDTWRTGPAMPTARETLGVAAVGGKLYAIGGYTGAVDTDACEEFDPATNAWTTRTPMPTARTGFAIAVRDGLIYCMGGRNGGLLGDTLTVVEVYDPATDTWATYDALAHDRYLFAAAEVGGQIYACGGFRAGDGQIAHVEVDGALPPAEVAVASFSNYLETALLNHVLRGTAYTAPATVYVGLHTGDPGETGASSEVSGNGYARQGIASNTTNWSAPTTGTTASQATVTFPTASATWGTVTHFSLWDAASAGNLLFYGSLGAAVAVAAGDAPRFAVGGIAVTLA